MANPNPPTEHLKATQFRPGQSGNPSGQSTEAQRLTRENAERASRIRGRILTALEDNDLDPEMTSELLRLLKDSEDRGYGSPAQSLEHTGKDGGPIETKAMTDDELARWIAFKMRSGVEVK